MNRFISNPHQYHGVILSDRTFSHSLSQKQTFVGTLDAPKSGNRMTAKGMQFSWWWNGDTISLGGKPTKRRFLGQRNRRFQ
jgi:hypothetical protein